MVPRYKDVQFVNLDALTYAGNLMSLEAVEKAENYVFVRGDIADLDLLTRGDIADLDLLTRLFERYRFSTVVHFAAESHVDRSIDDPLSFARTNVIGTSTLLEVARHAWPVSAEPESFRFHHISTDEVFGSLDSSGFFDEQTPYDPRSPYSASKSSADHFVRAYGHTYGLPYVISNCSNNYGPFQFPEKLIPLMINNAVSSRPLPVYGDGMNVRDWIYVSDHCRALEVLLRRGSSGETYTVGGHSERTNVEVVQLIADLVDEFLDRPDGTSREMIQFVADRPGHDFRYAIDCSKLESELGWTPRYTLEEGLRKTVRWYLDHREWVDAIVDDSYLAYYEKHYGKR
jgi:dTDP-glucose 4,6-dehydratase